MTRQIGRPPRLDEIHHHTRDGTPVSIADTILVSIRAGDYVETAAALAGVHKDTFYEWLKVAGRTRKAVADGKKPGAARYKPTDYQRRCVIFSDAVAVAEAHAESAAIASIAEAGRVPSQKRVTVTRKEGEGEPTVVEERVEELPPDWRATAWRAERRWSQRYGHHGSLELTGADGGPISIDVRAARVKDRLAALQGVTAARPPDVEDDLDEPLEG